MNLQSELLIVHSFDRLIPCWVPNVELLLFLDSRSQTLYPTAETPADLQATKFSDRSKSKSNLKRKLS